MASKNVIINSEEGGSKFGEKRLIPLVRDTIRTWGFTRWHGVNGGRKFIECERSLKKEEIRGLKLRNRKRGEELVTG